MIPVVFGADDYGIAPATSAVIRSLIAQGRLSATSCMVVFPEWPEEAARLVPYADRADLGLHLTLTDQTPLGPMPRLAPEGRLPSMGALTRAAWLGRLDRRELRDEIVRQLTRFADEVGRMPDHVDGHHHVHQLPTVRDALLDALADLAPRAAVRTCRESPRTILARGVAVPRALLFAAAAAPLTHRARAAGHPVPGGFTGAYGFDAAVGYDDRLRAFLQGARPGTFVMTHPGAPDDVLAARDGMVAARAREAAVLGSDALPRLLDRARVRIARIRDALQLPVRSA